MNYETTQHLNDKSILVMKKPKLRHRRINPIVREPIMRKGGEHKVNKGGLRQQAKQSLKCQLRQKAGASSLSDLNLCA